MSGSFSFGFASDDIEENVGVEASIILEKESGNGDTQEQKTAIEPQIYTLRDLLSYLPSHICYSIFSINGSDGQPFTLARRELWDIRAQIMAEDKGEDTVTAAGLSGDDITTGIYEGGLKTWECAIDLARYVLDEYAKLLRDRDQGLLEGGLHMIELGAGTALPTLTLFHLLLSRPQPQGSHHRLGQHLSPIRITLSDYNLLVLIHATIPNILLQWGFYKGYLDRRCGELYITPALLNMFLFDLEQRGIAVECISGGWGKGFEALLQRSCGEHKIGSDSYTLALASETIYSPTSIKAFLQLLSFLLSNLASRGKSRALVAAKRVYFGVGGDIVDFVDTLRNMKMIEKEVWHTEGQGVERLILEVKQC